MAIYSLSRIIAYWAEKQPNTVAITHEDDSITWQAFDLETNQLARAYANRGVQENDFVTIALPNGLEFFKACFATWKLGATPQPISAKLPLFEMKQIIELGAPKLTVGIDNDTDGVTNSLPIGFNDHLELNDEALDEKTAISLKVMTSGGSTGRPKLIVSALPAAWDTELEYLNIKTQGAMLIPGPLYHNGPFLWAMISLFRGNHVCVTTRFDAEQTLALIAQHKVDIVYMVPTMMQRIWKLDESVRLQYDLSSLETLWHLAAPCPVWLKEAFMDWLGPQVIWELYGGTEGQGSTIINGLEWLEHRGSVGKPGEECEMKIVAEDGGTLPSQEIGEVFIRPLSGQGSTYHYIGAEAKSIDGGWESLGDMGYMDEDGYLYLADRQTDMILSGGANIYPAEIEAAIDAFPGIRSSAVIGLPHEDLGSVIHAIVDSPEDNDEDALLSHLAERLARYKIPRTIEWVNAPLRDDAGKLRRKQLRAERIADTA